MQHQQIPQIRGLQASNSLPAVQQPSVSLQHLLLTEDKYLGLEKKEEKLVTKMPQPSKIWVGKIWAQLTPPPYIDPLKK